MNWWFSKGREERKEAEIVERLTDELTEIVHEINDRDIAQQADVITANVNSILQEGGYAQVATLDINQLMRERGYAPIGGVDSGLPASDTDTRQKAIQRSRNAFFVYPLGYNPVQMTSEFALGDGGIENPVVEPKADEAECAGQASVKAQQKWLDSVWEEQINQETFTSHEAQLCISNKLLYDGEIFLQISSGSDVMLKSVNSSVFSPP